MSKESIDKAWRDDPKSWRPGCGEPVKVLYRPLKAIVAGVPVILGPETELLVDDAGWQAIYTQLDKEGFDDAQWELRAGTQGRVNPLTPNAGPFPKES